MISGTTPATTLSHSESVLRSMECGPFWTRGHPALSARVVKITSQFCAPWHRRLVGQTFHTAFDDLPRRLRAFPQPIDDDLDDMVVSATTEASTPAQCEHRVLPYFTQVGNGIPA